MKPVAWALLAATFFLSGCTAQVSSIEPLTASDDMIVYVIARGWHTDIGLPVEEIVAPLARLTRDFPGVRYLTFGFGERQFLLTRRRTFGLMLSALLPSRSALLMTALGASPQAAFGEADVVVLHVSRAGLGQIEASLWHELETPPTGDPPVGDFPVGDFPGGDFPGGDPPVLAEGPYPGSVFYAARDTYDGLYTCNTWTAAVLHAGGLPVPTAGVLFAGQVMAAARSIAARQASTGHT